MQDLDVSTKRYGLYLFKGDPITRKTSNAASFPDPRFFDFDGKVASAKVAHPSKAIKYDFFTARDFDRWRKDFDTAVERNPAPGGTFIFDSITSFTKIIIQYSLSYRDPKQRNKNEMNPFIGNPSGGGYDIASWQDYKFEENVLSNFMSGCLELAKTSRVIFIAHVLGTDNKIEATPDGEKKVLQRPIITAGKKTVNFLPAQCGEIYHFMMKKQADARLPPNYLVRTQNSELDYASTVLPLPAELDVTDGNLYGKMQKILKEKGIEF
jgi:hypothetical protein